MQLREYLTLLQRWWWLLVLGTVLTAGASYIYTRQMPPVYQSTATLLVNVSVKTAGFTTGPDASLSRALIKTYTRMAAQPVVLEAVAKRLDLPLTRETLSAMVSVNVVKEAQLFTITARGSDPGQVRDLANTVAAVFIKQQNERLEQSLAANAISVVQPALLPLRPMGPGLWVNVALAAAGGLILMLGLALLLEHLDDTVKTQDDLAQAVSLPVLGSVSRLTSRDGVHNPVPLIDKEQPQSPAAEAYRLLRTNLAFSTLGNPFQTLLVTSPGSAEGKSTTVANLALVLAQAGKRVIAVDADLRRPSLHRIFGLENSHGLTNLLLDLGTSQPAPDPNTYFQPGPVERLQVLTSGPLPPNPVELLQSSQFVMMLELLQGSADLLIFDSPPALAVADALVLAQRSNITLLVVDSGRTHIPALHKAVSSLQASGTHMVGAMLNRLPSQHEHYRYYYGSAYRQGRNGREKATPLPQVEQKKK